MGDVIDFKKFIQDHKEKINKLAEQNTTRNSKGQATISKDDPWFYEDEWDEHFESLEDEWDSWDENLNLDRATMAMTVLGATHWIAKEVPECEGRLTVDKAYTVLYDEVQDEFYIVDDVGENNSWFQSVYGDFVKL